LNRFGNFVETCNRGLDDGEDGRRHTFRLVDLLLLLTLGLVDHCIALAFEVRIKARFSSTAHICFSIALSTSFGGVMFLITYRKTLTPQESEALSSSFTTWILILVRSSNVRSSSIFPISLRSVVCASWIRANA